MTFLGMPTTAPRGVGNLRGDEPFPAAARKALADPQLRRNLHHATSTIRDKSGRVIAELPDWQQLRDAGSALKADTMARLPDLVKFSQLHGIKVATIADLIAYRRRYDNFISRVVETEFESRNGGKFRLL